MRMVGILMVVSALHAQTLVSLIDSAQSNGRIESQRQQSIAAALGYETARRSYFPRIDAFANVALVDKTGGFDAKQTYAAGLKGEVVVFDGFRRENLLEQNRALEKAAQHRLDGAKKEVALEVVKRYFELQNTLDEQETLETMKAQLEAQTARLKKFRTAGLASTDALMRMEAELSDALYRIEEVRYEIDRQREELSTIANTAIVLPLPAAEVVPPADVRTQEIDAVRAMRYARDAKIHEARTEEATLLPTLKLEDQFSFYDYYQDPIAQMRVERQNKFVASMGMRLFDFSAASAASEALMAQAQAQSSDLAYALKEAGQNLVIAGRYIERSRSQIDAAQSAYDAAVRTFEAVRLKYEARVVDYVTYLDSLHTFTDAANRLSRARRTLFYAYAAYYYYAGLDPREFVR